MSRPTPTQVAAALVETLRAGTHEGQPIKATLLEGSGAYQEIRAPQVIVPPPSIAYDVVGEGWQIASTEWALELHTSRSNGPSTEADMAFVESVSDALARGVTLDGVVAFVEPLSSQEPITNGASDRTPTLFTRELRITINH